MKAKVSEQQFHGSNAFANRVASKRHTEFLLRRQFQAKELQVKAVLHCMAVLTMMGGASPGVLISVASESWRYN